jgi:hypothetical protein
MSEPDCPYLVRERTTYRESLDLSRDAPVHVVVTWRCAHPFHGMSLDLGDAHYEVEAHCAACPLPRPETTELSGDSDGSTDSAESADAPDAPPRRATARED